MLLDRYFARRVVNPSERPGIMRKHIYTGVLGSIWIELLSGLLFVYFGTSIGMTRFQWGVLAAGSSWLISAQLVSALITQRTGRRKALWFWFSISDRGLRLAGIVLAFWLWQAGWPHAAVVFIVALCLAELFSTMASPPWLSWLADIIPSEEHGTFWGRRSAWISLASAAVVIAAALITDYTPGPYKLQVILGTFVVAAAIGTADLLIHGTIPEPEMALPGRHPFWPQVLEPLRDRAFRPWLRFNAAWTFSMMLGGGLAPLYFLDELNLKSDFVGGVIVVTCIPLLGATLSGAWSGRLVDRFGTRPVLFWGHTAWATLPLFWLLATPGTALALVALSGVVAGVSYTAATTASNKLVVRVPPPGQCPTYTAVSTCLGSIAGGAAALIAGILLDALRDWHPAVAGRLFGAFHLLFAVSFVLRLASAVFLVPRMYGPAPHKTRAA